MKKNQELEKINARIEYLFNEWKALQPLKPENQERFDKKVRLDWNYHSNKIEGNTLTYGETELLLVFGRYDGGHLKRDYLEMQAHDIAINKVKEFAKDRDRNLTEADIRGLNKIILKEPFWSQAQAPDGTPTQKKIIPGQYKEQPNHVKTATGEIFKFAEPHEVPLKMDELMKWFHKEMKHPTLPIASFLAELHHRFILIHPFDDGNGRVVRLLVNYVLLRLGYPPLVVKSSDRENYLIAINKADTSDMDAFAIYLGKALIFWLELGIKAAKGEDISEADDVDKEVDLFIREQKSKGLNEYFSKESAINLIDNLSEVLFDTFKNKFKSFDKLFHSMEISQIIKTECLDVARNQIVEYSEKFTDNISIKHNLGLLDTQHVLTHDSGLSEDFQPVSFDDFGYLKIYIILSYKSYQGQLSKDLEKPFNMEAVLLIEIDKFKYKISIESKNYIGEKTICEGTVNLPGGFNYNYEEPEEDREKEKTINEERYYNQLLTQEEANKFVAEGKKEFLKLLKSAVGKDTDDKKNKVHTLLNK